MENLQSTVKIIVTSSISIERLENLTKLLQTNHKEISRDISRLENQWANIVQSFGVNIEYKAELMREEIKSIAHNAIETIDSSFKQLKLD